MYLYGEKNNEKVTAKYLFYNMGTFRKVLFKSNITIKKGEKSDSSRGAK